MMPIQASSGRQNTRTGLWATGWGPPGARSDPQSARVRPGKGDRELRRARPHQECVNPRKRERTPDPWGWEISREDPLSQRWEASDSGSGLLKLVTVPRGGLGL